MVILSPTQDLKLIKKTISHPSIWKWISEKGQTPDEFCPSLALLISVYDDEIGFMGLFGLHHWSKKVIEVHTCLLPVSWGRADHYASYLIQYVWKQFPEVTQLITRVPSDNRLAYKLAIKSGMTEFGSLKNAFETHDSGVVDILFLNIYRPDILGSCEVG